MFSRVVSKLTLLLLFNEIFVIGVFAQCTPPSAPVIGTIIQPTCAAPVGSISISGLPAEGTWTLTRYPDGATGTGTGTAVTVSGLSPGTYSFTVTIQDCTSERSGDAVINQVPSAPSAPVIVDITQPSCVTATGSIAVGGLPESGTWTLTRYPGALTSTGTGAETTLTGLSQGTYSFTVTAQECTSAISADAVINQTPAVPSAPAIGTITQPTCETATGSIALSGLPSAGTWTLTRFPGGAERTGTGATTTVSGLEPETYYFTVTTAGSCTSGNSSNTTIDNPPDLTAAPVISSVTQPTCDVRRGTVNLSGLPSSGTWSLSISPGNTTIEGSGVTSSVADLDEGRYTFRVTNAEGCRSASSENAVINDPPVIPAVPVHRIDCYLGNGFAVITVVSPVSPGFEYRIDNGPFRSSRTFMEIGNGNHTISVRSSGGCITAGDPFEVSCGCVNRPSVTLSSRTGTTCGNNAVTVNGNTYGGSATSVTITEDGSGSVTPSSSNVTPFSFTYTPGADDAGRVVTITVTTNNPLGEPCSPASSTYALSVGALPPAPVAGTITHPTCTSATGSVSFLGLPSTGNWALTRTPGNITTEGTGATTTIAGIESGAYTFTLTYNGCTSIASSPVVVNSRPVIPAAPSAGQVVQPTCTSATGTINLTGLPAEGTWTMTRYPGTVTTTGSGPTSSISDIPAGTYNFAVTNASGCVSALSANIIVNAQPPTPAAPVTGSVTAPTCAVPLGSVVLSGLPAGNWSINSVPGGLTLDGNTTTTTVSGLSPGAYSFTVTNRAGCTSASSTIILIPEIPDSPVLMITDPAPVCAPATADITSPGITAGSTAGLTFTYWLNQAATAEYNTPAAATAGTYYIKATNAAQCFVIMPVNVTVLDPPVAEAGSDQELEFSFITTVSAIQQGPGETGTWSVYSGSGSFSDPAAPATTLNELEVGENVFLWTVTNGACPASTDTLRIIVRDLNAPTLITPNDDGINDNFILTGIEILSGNELIVFDRRGVVVFKDMDYKNDWNGVDYNGRPLEDDTYFFVLKTGNYRQRSGFIVIRR